MVGLITLIVEVPVLSIDALQLACLSGVLIGGVPLQVCSDSPLTSGKSTPY